MITTGREIDQDLKLETDVCVVGSGAGGAVTAKELREAGRDVILLEEGGHFTRKDFNRDLFDMMRMMYRDGGGMAALGIPPVLLPMGRTVGGTTTINSGTCFRTPEKVLRHWGADLGVPEVSPTEMDRFFEKVERVQNVSPVREEILGTNAKVVRRGAEKLGYSHGALLRNVNDKCRGCGVCCFGCPSDAKLGMNLTYIPMGVEMGLKVFANCRVEGVTMSDGRMTSVRGSVFHPDQRKVTHRFEVRARVFVLACGTIMTPYFLRKNGLFNSSGEVGRNLTIHPAVRVHAMFDEEIYGWRGVPQSYFVDQFKDEGIMMEGAHGPPALMAPSIPFVGKKYAEILARIKHLAAFGVMVSDTTRGRVYSMAGRPTVVYQINRYDTERLVKGVVEMSKIFFAAGAREVYPTIHGFPILKSPDEISKIEPSKIKRSALEITCFHPLGTCRMGVDPKASVVDPYGRVHETKNVFISDGSIMPTSLGVNPQITIMAFATRNAEHIANRYPQLAG